MIVLLYILFGMIAGFFGGLGMGGGTILIFLLTFLCRLEQHIAQATNLIFFIPTSIIAIIVNIKNKNIDIKLGIYTAIFGILGAIIGANIAIYTDVNKLRKLFGIFLILIVLHEIYSIYKGYKKEKIEKNKQ